MLRTKSPTTPVLQVPLPGVLRGLLPRMVGTGTRHEHNGRSKRRNRRTTAGRRSVEGTLATFQMRVGGGGVASWDAVSETEGRTARPQGKIAKSREQTRDRDQGMNTAESKDQESERVTESLVRLTPRDKELLAHVAMARYLSSAQIKRARVRVAAVGAA